MFFEQWAIEDKHANYVIQCILERGRLQDKIRIVKLITEKVLEFAKNKVSSNVVERCFEITTVGPDAWIDEMSKCCSTGPQLRKEWTNMHRRLVQEGPIQCFGVFLLVPPAAATAWRCRWGTSFGKTNHLWGPMLYEECRFKRKNHPEKAPML